MKKIIIVLFGMAVSLLGITACANVNVGEHKKTEEFLAMDTVVTITVYGYEAEDAIELAKYEIERLDEMWSVGKPDSEINRINRGELTEMSADTEYILEKSRYLNKETDGAFDITIRPLVKLWGFENKQLYIPSENEIQKALSKCGMDKIETEYENIKLYDGAELDFGGIAKGYTSDRLMKIFGEFNIRYAIVSIGGNIQCFGRKTDGDKFNIAIKNPYDTSEIFGSVKVSEAAVISSGGYERYFTDEKTGKKYCHIIDPKTGKPVESDIESVTIVSIDGTMADGLATSLYVMGITKAIEYWKMHNSEFDFVILGNDNTVYATAGIADSLTTDYKVKEVLCE